MSDNIKDEKNVPELSCAGAQGCELQVYQGIFPGDYTFELSATSEAEAAKMMVRELIGILEKDGENMIMAYLKQPKGSPLGYD